MRRTLLIAVATLIAIGQLVPAATAEVTFTMMGRTNDGVVGILTAPSTSVGS